MKMSSYLKYAFWDYLLVTLVATGLTYTALNGFYIAPSLQYSPIPAASCIVLVALLFVAVSAKRLLVPVCAGYAVLCVAACAMAASMSGGNVLQDSEANHLTFAMCIVVVSTLSFFMSRRRATLALLLILGIFCCGWVQFFYERNELLWMLVFLVSAISLVIYKNYQLSAMSATSVRSISFPVGFGVALGSAAVAVAAGALIWFAVLGPLGVQAADIKLITEYRSLETVQVHGTSSEYLTPDISTTSDKTNDGVRTTDDLQKDPSGIPMGAQADENSQSEQQTSGAFLGINIDSIRDDFDFEADPQRAALHYLSLLLIPLAIAAYFVGRRMWRTRRLKRISALPLDRQVSEIYLLLIRKLSRVGFAIGAGSTALEFAANNAGAMGRFDEEGKASFQDLTATYAAVAYGKAEPSDEEVAQFHSYYCGFWKAARKQLGNFKYFFASFRL